MLTFDIHRPEIGQNMLIWKAAGMIKLKNNTRKRHSKKDFNAW